LRLPPRAPLFPYATLFRSNPATRTARASSDRRARSPHCRLGAVTYAPPPAPHRRLGPAATGRFSAAPATRTDGTGGHDRRTDGTGQRQPAGNNALTVRPADQ